MTIDLADCEKYSKLYYSKTNMNKFFENISTFEELSEFKVGGYNFREVIEIFFNENEVKPVSENEIKGCLIKNYVSKASFLNEKIPLIFYDIIRESGNTIEPNKQLILLNLHGAFSSQNPILIIKDCYNKDCYNNVTTVKIPFVTNFIELYEWLNCNRPKRNYNFEDNRHIKNHPQSQVNSHQKSPIIGGLEGKKDVSVLLRGAVGDKRETKDLINFDYKHECYIWYEYENENPQNQYHGYHLVKKCSHEVDIEAEKRIPKRVKYILDYLSELKESKV